MAHRKTRGNLNALSHSQDQVSEALCLIESQGVAIATIPTRELIRGKRSENGAEISGKEKNSHQRSTTIDHAEDRKASFACLRSRAPITQGPDGKLLPVPDNMN